VPRGDGAINAGSGVQNAIPLGLARPNPLDTVTNSLAGPTANTLSRGTNRTALGSVTNPINRLGSNVPVARNVDPSGRSGVPPVGERRFVPSEVVIGLASDLSPRSVDDLARRHRLTPIESQQIALIGTTYHRWRIGDGRGVSEVIRALEADGAVRTAQPNYRFTLQQSPQSIDPVLSADDAQYALGKLHIPQAHRFATGEKVLVAVIDSGIDTSHAEIADAVADRFDAIGSAGPPHLHGTGMAGAIVAHSRLTGIAPAARILAIRAFSGKEERPEATTLGIIRSIDWAIAHGARVINMSFAGPYDPDVARSLAAARQKGAVLVAAAGNAGPKSAPLYPAADKNVIAVTATNAANQLLAVANRGRHIALAAPGVDVLVPSPNQTYQMSTGTSVAAAQVSGIAALLIELQPTLTPDQIREILQSTATDLGPKGPDEQFGSGLADAHRAVVSLGRSAVPRAPVSLFSDRWPDTPAFQQR
jgi:subtilisin family serine protease